MAQPATIWNDDRIEQILGQLLRIGVLAAAALVLLGGVMYLARTGSRNPRETRVFIGEKPAPQEAPELNSLRGVIRSALAGHSLAIIQLGLLVLVATPVARVIFSAFAFLMERDFTYVAITVFVLGILLYSLVWGA